MAKQMKKFGKLLSTVSNVFAIPDAIDAVRHVADTASPIIEKELDRRHERKQALVPLDNVRDVPLDYAQSLLESRGFTVLPILAKPHAKYANERPMEVVAMHPRAGKYPAETLVKLYFVTEEIIQESQKLHAAKNNQLAQVQKKVNQQLDALKQVKLPTRKKNSK